jgi:predicted kinase
MDEKTLILVRGLPGSGKTSFAKIISEGGNYPVFEIDDYFTDDQGTYSFRFDENHSAYKQCIEKVEAAMQQHCPKIIVANTFTMEWEIEPYLRLGILYNYKTHVVVMENRHGSSNVHSIPEEQIQRMREKFRTVL